jgi:hypothetical protein
MSSPCGGSADLFVMPLRTRIPSAAGDCRETDFAHVCMDLIVKGCFFLIFYTAETIGCEGDYNRD